MPLETEASQTELAPSKWQLSSVRLTVLLAALTCVGVVASASAATGQDFTRAILKRLALTSVGVGAFWAASHVSYLTWRRHQLGLLAAALGALVAVLIPGIGTQINGARRWIGVGLPVGFQPSEFAKLAVLVFVAAYCERNQHVMHTARRGFLVPFGVVGLCALLILAEPDFGTAALLAAVGTATLLVLGTRLVYVLLAGGAALPILHKLVFGVPYRMQRVISFLDPWQDPLGSGYQLIQSKIAIGSGGLFGLGVGMGRQKAGFLPGADNDFIFALIGEELGFLGCVLVIALFVLLLWESLKVAVRAPDLFAFGLATGLAVLIGTQAAAHIAVVTGTIPTKGLSLPLVSSGGSSLLASLLGGGILVNIARAEEQPELFPSRAWQDDVPGYEKAAAKLARRLIGWTLKRAARASGALRAWTSRTGDAL